MRILKKEAQGLHEDEPEPPALALAAGITAGFVFFNQARSSPTSRSRT